MKEKKISIKYVLNTKVKPELSSNGTEEYPVYIQVIFNRSMTQFPAKDLESSNVYYPISLDKFDILYKNKSVSSKKKIEDIIKYESKIVGLEKYSLKGLAKRISKFYSLDVRIFINNYLHVSFMEPLQDKLTYRQYNEMERFIFNNHDFNADNGFSHLFDYNTNSVILTYYYLSTNLDSIVPLVEKDTKKLLDASIHLEAYYWYSKENLYNQTSPYPSKFSFYDWIISKSPIPFLSFWMNQKDSFKAFDNRFSQLHYKFILPILKTEIKDILDIQEVVERGILRSGVMKSFELELKT